MRQSQEILDGLITRYPALSGCRESIWDAFEMLFACLKEGKKLVLCGNGGSCADCDHITGELLKGFCKGRPLQETEKEALRKIDLERGEMLSNKLQKGLAVVNLCANTAAMTAVANDTDADLIFAQQLMGLGKEGDVLVCICPRGSAENILNAIAAARLQRMKILGMTAWDGGKMKGLCDVLIAAPEREVYCVQEMHLPIYHALCLMLEVAFFEE